MKHALALLVLFAGCSVSAASDLASFMADRVTYARVCNPQFDHEADAGRVARIQYDKLDSREQKHVEDYASDVALIYSRPGAKPSCEAMAARMSEFIKAH